MKKINTMKKTLVVFFIACMGGSFHAAHAQTGFGLKAGVNFSRLDIDDGDVTSDSRTGFHAGIFFRERFDLIGIQPELLLFTQQGKIRNSVFGTVRDKFTYLSIPVMFKFYPAAGFNVQVGPQFGFLLDGEREYDTVIGSGSRDITDYYKKSDISISAGLGYDFNFGLGLDFRYNIGVKDINDAVDGDEAKSRVFLISVGWNFIRN